MPPKPLVILDCDGVLVDTERITTALLAEVITELGWPMTGDEAVTRFKGHDLHEVQTTVEARLGRPLGAGFLPDYRQRMAQRFETLGVPTIAGAPELLDGLDRANLPHAIASNGPQEKMRLSLGRIGADAHPDGWYGRFRGRCFSAYDIQRWKPDPALFLHAALVMGAHPADCVVVEDSTSGITAARAAGMRVIGFADLTPAEELDAAGATQTCRDLAEVADLLHAWLA